MNYMNYKKILDRKKIVNIGYKNYVKICIYCKFRECSHQDSYSQTYIPIKIDKCVQLFSLENARTMPRMASHVNEWKWKQIAAINNEIIIVRGYVFVGCTSRNVLAEPKSPVKVDENEI